MIIVGDINTWLLMLGIIVLLCIVWAIKWIYCGR